jgi:hypothetical protein
MEMEAVVELIGSLGFPIVCVIALGFFIWKAYQASGQRAQFLLNELKENRIINGKFAQLIENYQTKLEEMGSDIKEIKNDIKDLKK